MIDRISKIDCTGCGACSGICPVQAISMQPDIEGFLYPKTDMEVCVHCEKCLRICPVLRVPCQKETNTTAEAYAAKTPNESVRQQSSSGGIFTEIASFILEKGGIVFGAAFDDTFSVKHIGVDSVSDLDRIRGSKYVQSVIGTAYKEAQEFLETGRLVLFTGTPCQIEGLFAFLQKDYENLYTQDIICHGVPSIAVWRQYITELSKKRKADVRYVSFRDKEHGWREFSLCIHFSNGIYKRIAREDPYMSGYLRNLFLRPSCYHCAFKTKLRKSDFTLADFWGIEKVCPEVDDNTGTSLVILHSEKGKLLFERVQERVRRVAVDLDRAIQYNSAMTASVPMERDRDAFVRCAVTDGFDTAAKKYLRVSRLKKGKRAVKDFLKRLISIVAGKSKKQSGS